jgi:hypothetical protein
MAMTTAQRDELLKIAAESSLTTLQTGYVDQSNIVRGDGILFTDVCPKTLYDIIDWVRAQKDAGLPSLITAAVVDWQAGPGLHSRTRGLLVH